MTANTSPRVPKLRRQKTKKRGDRAFVEIAGRRIYLGTYDTDESQQAYHQLIAEWLAGQRQPSVAPDEITVVELCAHFWRFAETRYRKPNGTPTSTAHDYQMAMRPLLKLYGSTPVVQFTPMRLKAVRQKMVEKGWCRGVVNQMVNLVRRVIRWGVAEQGIPVEVHTTLTALDALRRGDHPDVRESKLVKPVPQAHVDAIRPHVSRQVWAIVQLQLLTGARPGELVTMRPIDLDTIGDVWTFSPADHKGAHLGHQRTIFCGPRAQAVIKPFLAGRPTDGFLFSPQEAEAERLAKRHAARETPDGYGNNVKTNRRLNPQRPPGERYDTTSYRHAIQRACKAAKVPQWHPHQLRHNAASILRRDHGIDVAQTILGHRLGSGITEIYAEANVVKAMDVIAQVG